MAGTYGFVLLTGSRRLKVFGGWLSQPVTSPTDDVAWGRSVVELRFNV